MESKKFRDKRTGKVVTRFNVLEIRHFEEVKPNKTGRVGCKRREFMDHKTGQCKNANDVYKYEVANQNITHDVNIDVLSKGYPKKYAIDVLAEFKQEGVAKDLVNMVSRKKVDDLSQANKRTLFWAKYWLNKYALRGIR